MIPQTPQTPRPAPWQWIVTGLCALGGPPAAAVAGFLALVTWSGCFIECTSTDHPDHVGAALLGLLAAGLLLSGPVLAGVLLRSGWAVLVTVALPSTVLMLGGLSH